MKPGVYPEALQIRMGDTFYGDIITLENLTPFGGPANPMEHTIEAQIKVGADPEDNISFTILTVDEEDMKIRLTLTPEQTLTLPKYENVWDLQVTVDDPVWVGTVIEGTAMRVGQVTQ